MRKLLLLSFVPMTLVLSAAGPPAPACADEGLQPDRTMLLAENTPSRQHGNGFGIVTVSAPQPGDIRHAMEGNARGNTPP